MAMIDEDQQDAVKDLYDKLADMYIKMIGHYIDQLGVQEVMFHDDWGSQRAPFFSLDVCREMLGLGVRHDAPVPEARTEEYYRKRPCPEIIGDAAEILEQFIKEEAVR